MHCIDQWQCGHEDLQPSLAGRIFSCKPQLHVLGWHRWEEELQCPWTRGTCCTVGLLCKRNMRLLHISHAPCLSFPFPPPPLPAQHRWSEAPEHAAIFKQELDRYVEISKISTCQLPQDFQWNRGFLSASSICHFHKEYMNLLFVGSFHRPIQSSLSAASQPSGWMSAQ